MKTYAGIGSRDTPPKALELLTRLASTLETKRYTLRSGGAEGADRAFEKGVSNNQRKIVFKANDCTPAAEAMASQIHQAWDKCNPYVRKLHGRNCMIILGKELNQPVNFVLCYSENELKGGTALGIALARKYGILVFNTYYEKQRADFIEYLRSVGEWF